MLKTDSLIYIGNLFPPPPILTRIENFPIEVPRIRGSLSGVSGVQRFFLPSNLPTKSRKRLPFLANKYCLHSIFLGPKAAMNFRNGNSIRKIEINCTIFNYKPNWPCWQQKRRNFHISQVLVLFLRTKEKLKKGERDLWKIHAHDLCGHWPMSQKQDHEIDPSFRVSPNHRFGATNRIISDFFGSPND